MRCRLWNPSGRSQADLFQTLPVPERRRRLEALSLRQALAVKYDWQFWARPKQQAPPLRDLALPDTPEWRYWAIFAGRMFGKTRLAAEAMRGRIERGEVRKLVLAAPRFQDVERVQIAALMAVFPPDRRPRYIRDQHKLLFYPWTDDAPCADICSGEVPDSFRGPEWDGGWLDEFAAFTKLDEVWQRLIPAMRAVPPKGGPPQLILTTTPRNKRVLHDLLDNPTVVLTQGTSDENAHNVAGGVIEAVRFVYGNSDLAEQELGGKLLGNEPGALFTSAWFDGNRVIEPPKLKKKVLVVDTSGSGHDNACECGMMLLGLAENGLTAYLLGDYSLRATPEVWARRMHQVYHEQKADEIVYESHYGGELVPTMFKLLGLRAKFKPIPAVGSKAERAQPVRGLVQSGRVKFVGAFRELELQCCTWVPTTDTNSPDRLDAFVHGVSYLFPVIQVASGKIDAPGIF